MTTTHSSKKAVTDDRNAVEQDDEMKVKTSTPGKHLWSTEIVFTPGAPLHDGLRSVSDLQRMLDVFLAGIPGIPADIIADFRLVCDEIGSNVVRHSNASRDTTLKTEVEADENGVILRMLDNGAQFDPFVKSEIPYIGPDLARRKIGGLGLYLIRETFPHARYVYRDGWNISEVEYQFVDQNADKQGKS